MFSDCTSVAVKRHWRARSDIPFRMNDSSRSTARKPFRVLFATGKFAYAQGLRWCMRNVVNQD